MVIIDPVTKGDIFFDGLMSRQSALSGEIILIDETVFKEVMSTYSSRLCSIAFYITKSYSTSEDIVQEAFLKLWKKRSELTAHNISGWLYRVVTHNAYKYLEKEARKKKALSVMQTGKPAIYTEVEERLIFKQSEEVIVKACSLLPQKQQTVYRLSREEGFSRNEIAHHLNISANTVRNHLANALQFIKQHIAGACIALLFFVFNNLFFNSDSTNLSQKDLYKVNPALHIKNVHEKMGQYFSNYQSILLVNTLHN